MQSMNDISFEQALGARVDDMLDACTRCGKCVDACPCVKPAGTEAAGFPVAEMYQQDFIQSM